MDQVLTVEHIRRRMDGIHTSRKRLRRQLDKLDADHTALCELLCAALKEHGPANDVPADAIVAAVAPKEDDD